MLGKYRFSAKYYSHLVFILWELAVTGIGFCRKVVVYSAQSTNNIGGREIWVAKHYPE
jgi:hypothetical protein